MSTEGNDASPNHAGSLALGPITQVSLFVRDITSAVHFYGDILGLPHLFTFGDLAFHDIHGVRLYLHRAGEGEWRPGSVLYFLVDDIAGTYGDLQAAGVTTAGAPHVVYTDEAGMQEWLLFFEDPDGNVLAALARVVPQETSPA